MFNFNINKICLSFLLHNNFIHIINLWMILLIQINSQDFSNKYLFNKKTQDEDEKLMKKSENWK